MMNSAGVMFTSHASHASPAPAPPQTLGMLFWGNRPSASFCRIKRRMVVESKGESMGAFSGSGGENNTPNSPESWPEAPTRKAEVQATTTLSHDRSRAVVDHGPTVGLGGPRFLPTK